MLRQGSALPLREVRSWLSELIRTLGPATLRPRIRSPRWCPGRANAQDGWGRSKGRRRLGPKALRVRGWRRLGSDPCLLLSVG